MGRKESRGMCSYLLLSVRYQISTPVLFRFIRRHRLTLFELDKIATLRYFWAISLTFVARFKYQLESGRFKGINASE